MRFSFSLVALSLAGLVAAAPLQARDSFSGQATYFYQNGNPGACGNYNDDSSYIVALDYRNWNDGNYCGKSLTIHHGDKAITAKVADMCPSCASQYSLDLSEGAFTALGDKDEGVLDITWEWD